MDLPRFLSGCNVELELHPGKVDTESCPRPNALPCQEVLSVSICGEAGADTPVMWRRDLLKCGSTRGHVPVGQYEFASAGGWRSRCLHMA